MPKNATIFTPTLHIKNVLAIDKPFLEKYSIKGMILDLDNTLSMHGSPAAEEGIFSWLQRMRSYGIRMVVVSNNTKKRVAPLAKMLKLSYFSFGCKPLTFGITRAVRLLGLPKKDIVVIGDQVFTDIMAGNFSHIRTILVDPFHMENSFSFRLKRKIEEKVR